MKQTFIFISIIAFALCSGSSTTFANDIQLKIEPLSFSEDGILNLEITFSATSDVTIYSWYGNIYPLLGYGLSVDAYDPNGDKLSIESVEKVLPKLPHPLDKETTVNYKYPNPLALQVSDLDGNHFRGCVKIQVNYDLSNDSGGLYSRAGLDLLNVKSNTTTACNIGEKNER